MLGRVILRRDYARPEQWLQLILIGSLCLVAAWLQSESLLRFYPVVMNLAFSGLFLHSLSTDTCLAERFARVFSTSVPEHATPLPARLDEGLGYPAVVQCRCIGLCVLLHDVETLGTLQRLSGLFRLHGLHGVGVAVSTALPAPIPEARAVARLTRPFVTSGASDTAPSGPEAAERIRAALQALSATDWPRFEVTPDSFESSSPGTDGQRAEPARTSLELHCVIPDTLACFAGHFYRVPRTPWRRPATLGGLLVPAGLRADALSRGQTPEIQVCHRAWSLRDTQADQGPVRDVGAVLPG